MPPIFSDVPRYHADTLDTFQEKTKNISSIRSLASTDPVIADPDPRNESQSFSSFRCAYLRLAENSGGKKDVSFGKLRRKIEAQEERTNF